MRNEETRKKCKDGQFKYLDLVFSVELEIVKCIFGGTGTPLVQEFHERDIFLCRNKSNFVKVRVSDESGSCA